MSKHEDDTHNDEQKDAGCASYGLEEPEGDVRLVVRGEVHLPGQAAQVLVRLCRHMVEVNDVAHGVQHGEEERRAGCNLVELNMRVQGNVLLDGELL